MMRTLLAMVLLAPGLVAAAPAPDPLRQFVEKVDTFAATFEQVQRNEHGEVLQQSSGRLWLARPGRFRWSYEKPYQQLVVCDGKTLWHYDPDLAQVTVRPAGATLQGTPAQLLTDRGALERHFSVERLGADAGGERLRLLPKAKDAEFRAVELWLKEGAPQRMRFEDPLGGVSEVTFGAIRVNAPVDAAQFTFVIPKGTEVISAE